MSKINCRIVMDFERPSKETLDKFRGLSSPLLDDCMNRMAAVRGGIHAFNSGKLLGPAFTLKVPYGDNLMLHKSVEMVKPGDILVIQCEDSMDRAIFGSLLVNNLKVKKLGGILIEGAIRDAEEICEMEEIPVYAKGTAPNGPLKNGPGEINTTIAIGGQVVVPGDIIFGDENGVVVIPKDYADEIAAEAAERQKAEEKILNAMLEDRFERPWVDAALEKLKVDVCPR